MSPVLHSRCPSTFLWLSPTKTFRCRRGVLLAGGAFGLLHNNGGRNWAFAAWASAIGVVYGAAFLYTEVLVCGCCTVVSNFTS